MAYESIRMVLEDAATLPEPLQEIVPVNYGEFFLRKDWYEILKMINEYLPKTKIAIATNGSMLDKKALDKLCKIPTVQWINFSINAVFDDTYSKFMGLPSENIEKIISAMQYLGIMRPDIELVASMVFDPIWQTHFEKDLFCDFWQEYAMVKVTMASSAGLLEGRSNGTKLPCRSIFSDLVVGFDGKISSCCFDAKFSIDLSNYNGIMNVWHNDKFKALRAMHNEHRREGLCAECNYA